MKSQSLVAIALLLSSTKAIHLRSKVFRQIVKDQESRASLNNQQELLQLSSETEAESTRKRKHRHNRHAHSIAQNDPTGSSAGRDPWYTSGIGFDWMNDHNHSPYSGQEGFNEFSEPFAYIPRSAKAPPPSNSPPRGDYDGIKIWTDYASEDVKNSKLNQQNNDSSFAQRGKSLNSRNDPPCTSVSCPRLRTEGIQYESYNDVNHIPYSGQNMPGQNPQYMNFIPRTDDPPPPKKEWGALNQQKATSDPSCTSNGCSRPQTEGMIYEPYNNFNHIPYAGQPGFHSPITFIPRADRPPEVVQWADAHHEFLNTPWAHEHVHLAQKSAQAKVKDDPQCTSSDCPRMATSALDYEGYNDVHHFPFSGQEGHSPAGDWAFIPRVWKPPAGLAQTNEQPSPNSDQKLQLSTSSDPICNSFGCTQYLHPESKTPGHPVDYFVADLGVDKDISDSLHHMNTLEDAYGLKYKNEKKVAEDLDNLRAQVTQLEEKDKKGIDAEVQRQQHIAEEDATTGGDDSEKTKQAEDRDVVEQKSKDTVETKSAKKEEEVPYIPIGLVSRENQQHLFQHNHSTYKHD